MNNHLDEVLTSIGDEFEGNISNDSRFYVEIDLGERGEELGFSDVKERYPNVNAVVPLKERVSGMTVRIDGRTYVHYSQFDSGVAVPEYVAEAASLPHKAFEPNDSMILIFA